MTMLQDDIFGSSKLQASPTVVVKKFLGEWQNELQGIKYEQAQVFDYFLDWFLQRYGTTKESVKFLIETRTIRTLQEQCAVLRKRST